MTLRVLGVDPGLTRCGIGVVDVEKNRRATMVAFGVVGTSPEESLDQRLLVIATSIDDWLDKYEPHVLAVERVFSQLNVSTVMGVAQASGVVIAAAARRGIPVALHTPSEVKAAVTGSGTSKQGRRDQARDQDPPPRRPAPPGRCRRRPGAGDHACVARRQRIFQQGRRSHLRAGQPVTDAGPARLG
ncbi:crossover junction endodeoxyribonuclease RuvC [Arthrobacter sp. V4I6]|nr:crossover junction endodeoxyribonuclease RuvC [Arthrobacter sp. V4I6]